MQLDENTPNTVATRPTAQPAGALVRWFREKASGITGTTLPEDYFNDWLGNIRALMTRTGITRTKGAAGDSDLGDAINAMIGYATPALKLGKLEWVGNSSVRIRPVVGADIVFAIDGQIVKKTGDLVFDMTSDLIPSEAALTPYYLYIEDDAGVLTPHIDSVRPYLPGETKPGYHSSGGGLAGYLCVGSVFNDSGSALAAARWSNGWSIWSVGINGPFDWDQGTSIPTAWQTLALTGLPLCAAEARFWATMEGSRIGICYGSSEAGTSLPSGAPAGYMHRASDAGMRSVLASLDSEQGTPDPGYDAQGLQFDIPIADPAVPAIKWGIVDHHTSAQYLYENNLRCIGYKDLYAPTF